MKQATGALPHGVVTMRGQDVTRRIQLPLLESVPGLVHLFTVKGSDTKAALADAAGRDLPLATLRQVHGARVRVAEAAHSAAGPREEGDALVLAGAGLAAGVWVADCLPILIADERTRAVAAVHAGWRGTVAGVLGAAIAALQERFGAAPSSLRMAMGPAIGACCFEVGDEVVRALVSAFPEAGAAVTRGPGETLRVDLVEANRVQARAAGVPEDRIQAAGLCTRCHPELLESYRRDRDRAGRMAALIAWRT